MDENNLYNLEWFKNRAFSSIKKISDTKWDYSDSLLLYLPTGEEVYESIQDPTTPYNKIVTTPEHAYLKLIAKDVISKLPEKFEYIDLGPGTEHKEKIFFDEIAKQGKEAIYMPVDISERYLEIAESHAKYCGLSVKKILSSFEDLPKNLPQSKLPRFVNIGLTFSNYDPQNILDLLNKIAGVGGFYFINSQIRERTDMPKLMEIYSKDAEHLTDDKLQLLGIDPANDINKRWSDDGIRVWCKLLNSNKTLDNIGMQQNDELLVFQSLRYTKDELQKELERFSDKYTLFEEQASFIAALIEN